MTVPLFISVAALVWIFNVVDGLTTPFYNRLLGRQVWGVGIVTTMVAILLALAVGCGALVLVRARWMQGGVGAGARIPDGLVPAGQASRGELVSAVARGALVGRLSMGNPASNGDFSGVIKNSFRIADGISERVVFREFFPIQGYDGRVEVTYHGYGFSLPQQRSLKLVGQVSWRSLISHYQGDFEAVTPHRLARNDDRYSTTITRLARGRRPRPVPSRR